MATKITNKAALRNAVAALNAGDPETYLAQFRPDARLHRFPAGIDDVDALGPLPCRHRRHVPGRVGHARGRRGRARPGRHPLHVAGHAGPGLALEGHGGAIVRFADGQIAECWNLPADIHAVAS